MIYTDGIHIVADSLEELHTEMEKEGIKRHWFHGVRKGHPHYDIPKRRKDLIDKYKKVTSKELLIISKGGPSIFDFFNESHEQSTIKDLINKWTNQPPLEINIVVGTELYKLWKKII